MKSVNLMTTYATIVYLCSINCVNCMKLNPIVKLINHLAVSTAVAVSLANFPVYAIDSSSAALNYGLVNDRLLKCKAQSNCVSTSSVNSVDKYARPWSFDNDPAAEFDQLVQVITSDPYLKLVEQDKDKGYLRAEAKSAFPPTGTDDIEFLINAKEKLITYRSNSRDTVALGTEIVGDGGANVNRLASLQRKLGLSEMQMDEDMAQYLKANREMNFLERIRMASQPNDINFLDNSVPKTPETQSPLFEGE